MAILDKSKKDGMVEIFTRFITIKGKRIYHPRGGVFHFWVPVKKNRV
ncbi:MAG: hypothetical protein ACJAY8_000287 [Sphingobacteriales bacterium]|jgi:hypothetical protein